MEASEAACKNLHSRLHSAIKQCQIEFGGKSEVATDQDECVMTLCCEWEAVFSYGLKMKSTAIKGVLSRVKGDDRLWRFVKEFLSAEDTSRFQSLPSVQTSVGYFRAWLRGSLNERTIENTLHLMLAEERTLRLHYETTAFMLNQECSSTLPIMAAGLNSIVFALALNCPTLDAGYSRVENERVFPNLYESAHIEEDFKAVPVLKKHRRKTLPEARSDSLSLGGVEGESEGSEYISHNSSQLSLTSYDDGDLVNFNSLGVESSYKSKSCEQLLEDAYHASKNVLGLPTVEQRDSIMHTNEELRQALMSVVKAKEGLEEEMRIMEDQLTEEKQRSAMLEVEANELKEHLKESEMRQKTRMDEIEKENDVLRDQLKHYISMLQRQEGAVKEDEMSEVEEHLQSQLSEMANMYGEVMELNSQLHKQIQERERTIAELQTKALESSQKKQGVSQERCPVFVWIPSVVKETKNGETFHKYQVLIRIYKEEWNVFRRYSEIRAFHKALQKELPEISKFSFPPKKALSSKSPEVLEDRRLRLQEFLRTVIKLCSQPFKSGSKQRSPYITESTTKSKFIKIFPFFIEGNPQQQQQQQIPTRQSSETSTAASHYNGL